MGIVFLNQEFVPEEAAKVSVFDRGFLFGDGTYATIQVLEGVPLFARLHIARLKNVLDGLQITSPEIKDEWLRELIEKNDALKGVHRMRILITGGDEPSMRLAPRTFGNLIMTVKPHKVIPYGPLNLALFPHPAATEHSTFKSLAHLNRYYVMEYGQSLGLDDAVTTSTEGFLLEAAFGNLVWVVGRTVYTPDVSLPLHFGITITLFLEMMRTRGYETKFVRMPLSLVPEEALFFRVNSMSWIRPIASIGDRLFQRNLLLEESLCEQFSNLAQNERIQSSSILI